MQELKDMEDDSITPMLKNLGLGYAKTGGHPLLLSEIAPGCAPTSERIATRGLDLHDVRACVREELRSVGAGDPGGEIDDADVPESLHGSTRRRRASQRSRASPWR